jgi:hypothetical protein
MVVKNTSHLSFVKAQKGLEEYIQQPKIVFLK